MKRIISLLLLLVVVASYFANAQYSEYANYAETKTGIFGSIAHETADSEVFDKKDFSETTFGFIKNGATFELLNTLGVKHPRYTALNMVLVKITSDPEYKYVGKTGWVHVKATTLSSRFDENSMRIDGKTSIGNTSSGSSFATYPELKTGLFGTIENESGSEVLDMKDFSPPGYGSGFLKNGATFDLLNTQTVKHPTYKLDMVLIRVTNDPDGSYTGKVGWVYYKATSLKNKFNPNTLKIEDTYTGGSSTTTGSGYTQFANYAEIKTGIYGSIAHETAESEVFDKKDFSTPGFGFIKNGATFDLLNTKAVNHPIYGSLNMVLIRVTYDPENKHTGKVGWVHIKATSLKSRINESTLIVK